MSKSIWLFVLGISFGVAASAQAETLADFHSEMNGCEGCHQEGAPSEDGLYEAQQCASCHGELAELEGEHHKIHADILLCANCHKPHELALEQKPSCDYCHDDGRNP